MYLYHIPTSRDTPSTGYWGVATAVHQFCEPKYATSPYVAEFYNAVSSFVYVIVAAYILSRREARADFMIVLSCLGIAVIGLGSVAFHGTMLFEYELCDEVPMLLFMAITLISKCGAHPLLLTRARCVAFVAAVLLACTASIVVYAQLANYELFVAAFTASVLVDMALALTWRSTQRVTIWATYLSLGCLITGKVVWEVEVRACSTDGRVWPLHVVWHGLSCASAYYGLLADMASRIDYGLSTAATGGGKGKAVVPIAWVGVPFTEVRVTCGTAQGQTTKAK